MAVDYRYRLSLPKIALIRQGLGGSPGAGWVSIESATPAERLNFRPRWARAEFVLDARILPQAFEVGEDKEEEDLVVLLRSTLGTQ